MLNLTLRARAIIDFQYPLTFFPSGVRQWILQVHVAVRQVPHPTLASNTDGLHWLRYLPANLYSCS